MKTIDIDSDELRVVFRNQSEWRKWKSNNAHLFDEEKINAFATKISKQGLIEPLTGDVYHPDKVSIKGNNYRESIRAGHNSSRTRSLLKELQLLGKKNPKLISQKAKIFAPEAVTPFALFMRGIFPRYLGSEYAASPSQIEELYPVPIQDLQSLTLNNSSFDLLLSNDVLEHIPSLDLALSECARILSTGGFMLSTFPFNPGLEMGIKKAVITNGKIEYLSKAEYHGNPVDPKGGSLVFEVPGWDILSRAKAAGFSDASMVLHRSLSNGVLGKEIPGVFVFSAIK